MGRICEGNILEDWQEAWRSPEWPPPLSCLQVLLLDAAPCALMLITCPFYAWYLLRRPPEKLPKCLNFLTKMMFSVALTIVFVVQCFLLQQSGEPVYLVVYATWAVATVITMILVGLEHSRGQARSFFLFIFWLVAMGSSLLLVAMATSREDYNEDFGKFSVLLFRLLFTSCLFLLHCLSDFHRSQATSISPEAVASPPSWLTFSWLNGLLYRGFKTPLVQSDLFEMMKQDTSTVVSQRLQACRNTVVTQSSDRSNDQSPETRTMRRGSFMRCLVRTFMLEMCLSHCWTILVAASNLVIPFIIGWLINFSSDLDEPTWHGYIYLAALFAVRLVGAVSDQATQYLCNRLAIRVRTASIAAIYNKALRMRQNTRKGCSVGEIVNLMSVDTTNIELFLVYSYWAWCGTLHLVVGAYLCYTVSGVAMLTGFGFIVLMLAVSVVTNQKVGGFQEQLMTIKDQRLNVVGEVLGGIKVIKLYGWELLFSEKIIRLRRKELKILLNIAFFGVLETFAFTASKFWMTLCILATFVALRSSHYLDPHRAFLILNYINIINLAVLTLPLVLKMGIKMRISIDRINDFLQLEDVSEKDSLRDKNDACALMISQADFKWETGGPTILKQIEMQVMPGQLVAVVGSVGSGKSSLLAATLGEMVKVEGYCNINSTVAHVPQEAWIQNLSIRENILFGSKFQRSWYRRVIQACCLQPDLDMLPAGDSTEIGEKGINLSGGQKQRVSLARAVYSQQDIYLLDDPLSAVDSHVGKSIFENVIGPRGLLKRKTRILVTHGLQWLPQVDYIYIIEDGKIKEAGTFNSVTASFKGAFANFVAKFITTTASGDGRRSSAAGNMSGRESMESTLTEHSGHVADVGSVDLLVEEEKLEEGLMAWRVYFDLFRAFQWKFVAITVALILSFHSAFNAFYVLLSVWTDDKQLGNFTVLPAASDERENKNRDYILLLVYCGIAQTVFSLAYSTLLQYRHVATSRVLHGDLLYGVMRAPISFFDTTPMGRILNRFSQDLDQLDSFVFFFLEICVEHGLFALGILAVISYAIPQLTIFTVPVVAAVYLLQRFYSRSVCRLKRLSSVNRSPVFTHFSETVSGLGVIRAHGQQSRFILENQVKVDRFQNPASLAYAANKWMQFWLDMIGCFLLVVVSLYVILYREDVKPGLVGLSLSMVVAITVELKAMSQKSSELESSIVAVERILEYCTVPSEAPWTGPHDKDLNTKPSPLNTTTKLNKSNQKLISIFRDTRRAEPKAVGDPYICRSLPDYGAIPSILSEPRPRSASPIGFLHKALKGNIYSSLSARGADKISSVDNKSFSGSSEGLEKISRVELIKSTSVCPRAESQQAIKSNSICLRAESQHASLTWPHTGHIQFVNFSCRYRKETERVLKQISFTIKGGEKIGVVGRTGAGKSSLVLSLFRLVEADEGKILIDGVDISTLGLHRLRQALTILPQDPVLFAGSLRENLDPSGKRSEVELWRALDHAHLKQFVSILPGQLDAVVSDGGGNLSMGQRQLVCLARTLLCQTRVLVLDEATAAVDLETDHLVQQTIHSSFRACTVIAIAHRLSSIIDYDRVLVLDQGVVVEFDSPKRLLENPLTAFHSLAKEAGIVSHRNSHL